MNSTKWLDRTWQTADYLESKIISFDLLDQFLTQTPQRILDIGCGLAFESEWFQRMYNSDLWLLDGDFEDTKQNARDRKYGSADSMRFYSRLTDLRHSFQKRNLRYTLVNANHVTLPEQLKFDLIYSNVSCGYHYPLDTYVDLLRKHSTADSLLIFDMHRSHVQEQIADNFEIVQCRTYPDQSKIAKYQIRLRN